MSEPQFILASASPRRRELLTMAGYHFVVHAAEIDESRLADESPKEYVERVAAWKTIAVREQFPALPVLAADTTVEVDGEVFTKPLDRADAERMLRTLSGRDHFVHTGVYLVGGPLVQHQVVTTRVTFREIGEAEMVAYLDSTEPYDKAGAYGIQGYAARWIPHIKGDFYNVVGLPVAAVTEMLEFVLW